MLLVYLGHLFFIMFSIWMRKTALKIHQDGMIAKTMYLSCQIPSMAHFTLIGILNFSSCRLRLLLNLVSFFFFFVLGLEFSAAKVPYPITPTVVYVIAAMWCDSSCNFRRSAPDISFYVLLWTNCCVMWW